MTAHTPLPRRILVTGSRSWENELTISRALRAAHYYLPGQNRVLVHGACPRGADAIADRLVRDLYQWEIEHRPADWDRFGNAAGPIRNQEMVQSGVDLCLAFWKGRSVGTGITIRLAGEAGVTTWIWRES